MAPQQSYGYPSISLKQVHVKPWREVTDTMACLMSDRRLELGAQGVALGFERDA